MISNTVHINTHINTPNGIFSPKSPTHDEVEIIGELYKNTFNKKKKKRVLRYCKQCKRDNANKLCIICSEQIKDHACYPCGHVCFCKDCSEKFIICRYDQSIDKAYDDEFASFYDYCPVCRDYIVKIFKIYL